MKKPSEIFSFRNFASFTVKYRWVMIGVFVALSVACAIAIPFTKIVYDVSTYLPDESTSAIGLSVLKEEFDDKAMTYAIVSDVDKSEVAGIVKYLGETEGVSAAIYDESTSYNEEEADWRGPEFPE